MTNKISLWAKINQLNNEYDWNNIEDFDKKKSIDDQLSQLDDRDTAKSKLQKELASIKTTTDLKDFLENIETDEWYNKYITTYAQHVSMKIWGVELAFNADDPATQLSIHQAIVNFFHQQVKPIIIDNQMKTFKELNSSATEDELEKEREKYESEFKKDSFEINSTKLEEKLKPANPPVDTPTTTTAAAEDSFFKKAWTMFKWKLATITESRAWKTSSLIAGVGAFVSWLSKTMPWIKDVLWFVDEDGTVTRFVAAAEEDAVELAEIKAEKQAKKAGNTTITNS